MEGGSLLQSESAEKRLSGLCREGPGRSVCKQVVLQRELKLNKINEKRNSNMKKRFLAILLTVCMVVSIAPAALAAEGDYVAQVGETQYTDIQEDLFLIMKH